jgi:integrase
MRRGEICALQPEDITGNIVHVCRNVVKSNDSDVWRVKAPKSYAGDRYIEFPDFVRETWERTGLVRICPDTITKKFAIILAENGIPHFRFHDLRHYSASIQHALGVPDVYIMRRGGWSNDSTLKQVYRHALEQEAVRQNAIINEHFSQLHDTKHDTQ